LKIFAADSLACRRNRTPKCGEPRYLLGGCALGEELGLQAAFCLLPLLHVLALLLLLERLAPLPVAPGDRAAPWIDNVRIASLPFSSWIT
jgi:hypothetical protein